VSASIVGVLVRSYSVGVSVGVSSCRRRDRRRLGFSRCESPACSCSYGVSVGVSVGVTVGVTVGVSVAVGVLVGVLSWRLRSASTVAVGVTVGVSVAVGVTRRRAQYWRDS
jgi:hypothetical protein